jgi:hypothetical protein
MYYRLPGKQPMIMMLPFLTGMLGVWFGIRGLRGMSITFWFITLVIFGVWANFHITEPLGFSL